MPTFKSDLIKQRESGKQITDIARQRGALTGFMQEITIPTGMVSGDIIELFELKPGEIISPNSHMAYEALGTSTTAIVGVAGATNRYLSSTNTASAGQVNVNTNTAVRTEIDVALTTTRKVILTIGGADPTAGQKIYFFWVLVNEAI